MPHTNLINAGAEVTSSNPLPVALPAGDLNIGNVDVLSIAAGDNNIGNVDIVTLPTAQLGSVTRANSVTVTGFSDQFVTKTLTPSVVAEALTAEDIVFATETITTVGLASASLVALHQVVVSDIDDQGDAQTLFFFNAATSLGTEGSVPDIDDTEILTCIGTVAIATGDWKDAGANRIATVRLVPPLRLRLGATTSLFVAGNTQGTPTHTASGLQYQFTFERL